ncbi:hypothetical protein ATI61_108293 [Archangium gephyra]|uniref:Lipoprotein n=1 Tax=Archangium gephyra TaxID=48 RepID=A0AAC8Q896_9BACT|nr:hypothetical protein [Archangium gephyra]AKJ02318.1 putative lipoprotein [Archangium gephyra]REG28752.1 hypothetical protein ATI61_108293 [Archangium gephyra]
MMRRIAIASVLAVTGCAGMQEAQKKPQGPTTTEERMRITNQPPFDVAVCQPKALTLPQPTNEGILVGALLSTRPEVMECLVDPKSRGEAETTRVVVKTTVNEQGGTHAISGENLTPEGTACIQKVVDTRVPLTALPAGVQPVTSESTFLHEVGGSASVKFGINPGSDFSGTVRLAQDSWCECYAPFAAKIPPQLKATVDLKKGTATPAEIVFDPTNTPEGDQLSACLQAKMMTLPVNITVTELKFPYRFTHFHSQAGEASADMSPELRFYQLDLLRNQRAANTAMAFGARANAAEIYEAVITKFQKTPQKKQYDLLPELTSKCNSLVEASKASVDALSAQLQAEQQSLANVQELKAKDAAWGELEGKLQEGVTATEQDVKSAQDRLKADQGACPKVNYK